MIVLSETRTKLNLGSGTEPHRQLPPPWVNVDIARGADAVADITSLPAWWEGSFSEVRASHVLEHLFLEDARAALVGWAHVLEPGGVLRVVVPDLDTIVEALVAGVDRRGRPARSVMATTAALAQIYGIGYDDATTSSRWRHRMVYDEAMLVDLIAGTELFSEIERYSPADDPAAEHGITDDSQNSFSLCVRARRRDRQ